MKPSWTVTFSALSMLALLTAWAAGCAAQSREYANPDVPIEVKAGQEFTIALESNRTTGYGWQLAEPLDENILKLVGSEYRSSATTPLPGAGGKEIWTFKAVAPGKTTVSLKYVRPWEKNVPPIQTAAFAVVVR